MENRKIKILLIEDSIDDAQLIQRTLEKSAGGRFQVTAVRKLRDGLEQIEKNTPDLILSDLGLPDSHGLDTVTKILLQVPHIPLVVLSGFDDEDIAIKAVQSGAQDYLVKGRLEDAQLEHSLFYSIERARLQAELEQHTQEIMNIQANLHKILENNADAIVVVGEDKRILFANPAVETLFCRRQKEILNQPFEFPLDGEGTSEIVIKCAAKEVTTAEMSVVKIRWEGSPAYLASLHNITKRKKMEEDLRASEEKYRNIVELARDGIITVDTQGQVTSCNRAFLNMIGYSEKEVVGKNFTALPSVDQAQNPEYLKLFKFILSGEKIAPVEMVWERRDGTKKISELRFSLMVLNGKITGVHGLLIDITERKQAEKTLRESEEKFSKAFQRSPEVIIISNIEDGMILEVNDTFLRLTGYTRDELVGRKIIDIGVWANPQQRADMVKILKEKGMVSNLECQFRMKSGEIRIWLFSAEIINIDNRPRMLSVNTDITERKKMEDELRFSDTVLKSLREGIFAMDNEFIITRWNEMCEKLYGIKASDAIGKTAADVIHMVEKYEGQNADRVNLLLQKGFNKEEQLHRTPRGDIWFDVHAQAIVDGGKRNGWLSLVSDITQRKLAEEALKRSEEKYRELIGTSPDGIISTDAKMRVIIWNTAAEKIFGYKEQEILGQSVLKIIPEINKGNIVKELNRLLKDGRRKVANKVTETAGLKKDGSEIPLEVSVSTRKSDETHILTITMRDISERKEAEEKLRESEERYRDLFENASDLIQSCNTEGRFIYVNKAWRDALGYSEKKIATLNFWDVIHPDYLAHCKQNLQKVFSGEAINNAETIFVAKNGRVIHVEGNVNPVFKDGAVVATRAIFHDITERKEAEEKMKKIDQMKSEFLSNVSHELRTPLQSISGFTKLIMNGQVPDPATQQEFFQIIDRETMHLGNLINGLLDMSRLEAGRFQIFKKLTPIRETFIESIKMFNTLARDKNITLTEDIPQDMPELEVDNERMRQVVINLVGNAIKFSDPGSSITVKTEKRENDLLFQVSDHGTGIKEESMKHLFERFYRAEGETVRGGTGLGLYISKQIVDAHGGRIWAESKFGEGSTFSFTLPLNGKGGNGNGKENTGH